MRERLALSGAIRPHRWHAAHAARGTAVGSDTLSDRSWAARARGCTGGATCVVAFVIHPRNG